MKFSTAINCMDGRVQLPVYNYLQGRFSSDYVDMITEPGPSLILSRSKGSPLFESIIARIRLSIETHGSRSIAIIGHHDCAGNPAAKDEQVEHIKDSVAMIEGEFPGVEVIGLWVDENSLVTEIE